ncbi:reverse transcriptase [Cucumis melo var. makuwa]|nr:reverse transcriptase [Cucumis melo var. makuwa]
MKVAGLLDPLPVPTRPWESVSMDFITHLPKVGDFEAILVIIDCFSKYATFIPTTKQRSAEMTAQLFFKHVVKLLSDSTALEEYLRHFVNARQKNWVQLLDVAQFYFNAQTSSSTGRSPFEIVSGRQPVLPHLIDHPFAGKNPQALNFTKEWKQTNDIARAYLEKTSKRMKKWADKKRRPLEFRAGDQKEDKDVEEILVERVRRGRRLARRIHEYLVKWKNLPVEETNWERVEDLEAWKQKIEDFKLRQLRGRQPFSLQCFLYDVFNYLISLSCFITTFSQERGGRLHHTASLSADSEFRTTNLLIELNKCHTIVLRSYDCDTQHLYPSRAAPTPELSRACAQAELIPALPAEPPSLFGAT